MIKNETQSANVVVITTIEGATRNDKVVIKKIDIGFNDTVYNFKWQMFYSLEPFVIRVADDSAGSRASRREIHVREFERESRAQRCHSAASPTWHRHRPARTPRHHWLILKRLAFWRRSQRSHVLALETCYTGPKPDRHGPGIYRPSCGTLWHVYEATVSIHSVSISSYHVP